MRKNKPLLQKDKGFNIKLPKDSAGYITITPKQLQALKNIPVGKTFCIISETTNKMKQNKSKFL